MPRGASAVRSRASWLGLPTRFRITPEIVTSLPEGGEAVDQGCGGLRLRLHVQHQHHRPAREGGQVGGRAGAVGGAVEQAHDAFDDQEVGVLFASPARVSGRIAQGSRLMQGRPLAAVWNIGSI